MHDPARLAAAWPGALLSRLSPRIALDPAPGPPGSGDLLAIAEEMAGGDPRLYQALLVLVKMLMAEDEERAPVLFQRLREAGDLLADLDRARGEAQLLSVRISVTMVNIEASLRATAAGGSWREVAPPRLNGEIAAVRAGGEAIQQGDPLVLDLGGDGINLRSVAAGARFDLSGSGEMVRTAFIQGDDALVFLDENGNNVADSGRELFGDQDGHAHGFAELAGHDANQDRLIDGRDPIFARLRLFQDRNGDGANQAEETMTLTEAGVESIDLGFSEAWQEDGRGNVFTQLSHFARQGGGSGLVADALLRFCRL